MAFFFQNVCQGDEIHRFAAGKKFGNRFKNALMGGSVKIVGGKDFKDIQQG